MSHYVGLDISLKEVSICVVDADGKVLNRASVPTEPDTIADYLSQEAPDTERVVNESGILATWLTRELERRDVPIDLYRRAHGAQGSVSAPQHVGQG